MTNTRPSERPARLQSLADAIAAATGRDDELDQSIADLLDPEPPDPVPDYTASVEACIALIGRALPGSTWHVGYGADGVTPNAAVRQNHGRHRAAAPTIPLALLRALVAARRQPPKPT